MPINTTKTEEQVNIKEVIQANKDMLEALRHSRRMVDHMLFIAREEGKNIHWDSYATQLELSARRHEQVLEHYDNPEKYSWLVAY